MRVPLSSLLLFVLVLSPLVLLSSAGLPKNAMLLQDVSTLVFTKGDVTNARRSSPVPQMACKSGPCQYAPSSAMCRNVGFDGVDVTWACEAELPKGVKFGKVEVSCEGYSSRDDERVLAGSCGLEYALQGEPTFDSEEREEDTWWNRNVRQNAGQKIHPKQAQPPPSSSSHYPAAAAAAASSWFNWFGDESKAQYNHAKDYANRQYDHVSDSVHHAQRQSVGLFGVVGSLLSSLFSLTVKAVAAVIIFYLVYKLMRPSTSTPPPPPQRSSPGLFRSLLGALPFGALFGGGADSTYPPSYQAPPPYPGHDASSGYNSNPYDKAYARQAPQSAQAQQSTGGFSLLHGLLGGSLLGYFLGRRRAAAPAAAATVHTEPASSTSWFGGAAPTRPAQTTVHHVHHNAPPPVSPAYRGSANARYPTASSSSYDSEASQEVPDVRTTETSTAYARTKRR